MRWRARSKIRATTKGSLEGLTAATVSFVHSSNPVWFVVAVRDDCLHELQVDVGIKTDRASPKSALSEAVPQHQPARPKACSFYAAEAALTTPADAAHGRSVSQSVSHS